MYGQQARRAIVALFALAISMSHARANHGNAREGELRLRPMFAANLVEGGIFPGGPKVLGGTIWYDASDPANPYLTPIGGTWVGGTGEFTDRADDVIHQRCTKTLLGFVPIPMAELRKHIVYCYKTG